MNEETKSENIPVSSERHLLTFYTRTPLHVGSGATVEVVDLPVARERTTNFPIMPGTGLKGVLLQRARERWAGPKSKPDDLPEEAKVLFGSEDEAPADGDTARKKAVHYAGCLQIMEAKLLAFPVRSLAGCFAWLTCPTALSRYQRDTGAQFEIPTPAKDHTIAGSELVVPSDADGQCVLEEYALRVQGAPAQKAAHAQTVAALAKICSDALWMKHLGARLAVVHDENFQHYVTSCTEVVQRIKINPATRTVDGSGLFTQENIPCETLFYSVITVVNSRRPGDSPKPPAELLAQLLPDAPPPLMQFGGDETTGHGFCTAKAISLAKSQQPS